MDDRDLRPDAAPTGALTDDEVGRLIETAGPRPEIPAADVAAITAAARAAWRHKVEGGDVLPMSEHSARRPVEPRVARRPDHPRWVLASGLAALLAIAAGLGWWVASEPGVLAPAEVARIELVRGGLSLAVEGARPRPLAAGEALGAGAVVATADGGGGATLRLASGTSLRLDSGTRVRLSSAGELDLAAGAIYADTGGGGGALAVHTAVGTARDVGTRFAVRLVDESAMGGVAPGAGPTRVSAALGDARAAMRVRVREGLVAVEWDGESQRAAAGEEVVLHADGSLDRRLAALHGDDWEWVVATAPGFAIEGRSLAEMLDWVAAETGWGVRYADAGLAAAATSIELHGDIGDLRPDQAAFAVLPGAGLEGELADGVLTVRRGR